MFHQWYDGGMGDAKTDCLNAVKGYPSNYVFKGARATYNMTGNYNSIIPFAQYFHNIQGEIANAVAARGYQGVSVNIASAIIGDNRITISFTIPVDQGSSEDVKNAVRSAVQGAGLNVASDTISVSNPSFEQICGTGGSGSPSTGTGSIGTPGLPGAPSGTIGSFFDNLAQGIGVSTPIALGGLAVAAYLLLKR